VGIQGGRIVAVGQIGDADCRVVEAGGKVVAPGFIDVHTHYDAQAFWDGALSPSPLHGFTTVIGGNCGFSIAPLGDQSDYLMPMLARVEGMPLESLIAGVPWDWSTTSEYLDRLEGRLAVNAGFMVGHSAIRRVVMGGDANRRVANETEREAMAQLLRDGLEAGGFGFSSSWGEAHNDDTGDMVPSRYADHDELVLLARVTGEFPGTSLEFIPTVGPFTDPRVRVMAEMSSAADRPLNWNALTVSVAEWARVEERLTASDYAAANGARVVALSIPTPAQFRVSFLTGFIFDSFPGWTSPMTLPIPERIAVLSDPTQRRWLDDHAQLPENHMKRFANWGSYRIMDVASESLKDYEGSSVADIATDEGKEPFDALLDIVVADGLRTGITTPLLRNSDDDWRARAQIWRDHRVVIGASDAGAHLDLAAQFNYPTLMIDSAVRRLKLLPLEEAVHLITDVPSKLYGLKGRGRVEGGAWADLVIFDPETIGSAPLTLRHDLPGDAARLFAEGIGIDAVFVNGVEIVTEGKFTENRPGHLLRAGRDTTEVTAR
jgi:N-acyl-D-aspartate/D-glutamate deacylase